jgi:choline dehydrogenase-like flavoprotein
MTAATARISRDFAEVSRSHFDVIVVGSGYGGGVAAARLARHGRKVAVLERGREVRPGEYPRDMAAAAEEFSTTLAGDTIGKADGLFDLRLFDDVTVLVGCGLGGTSLINANVAIEPEDRVFETWPQPPEGDWPTALKPYFEKARRMLGSTPYPAGKTPPKLAAMQRIADAMGEDLNRPAINVTFQDGHNAAGVWQSACVDCGDCVTGCNYGAKNTVLMNYLPDAHAFGAELLTGAEVLWLSKSESDPPECRTVWTVHVRPVASRGSTEIRTLTADVVILAAGTLGSTEILLRSTAEITLSKSLGHGFSGNGDTWSLGFNANMPDGAGDRAPVHAIGAGTRNVAPGLGADGEEAYRPGPCITGMIHLRDCDLARTVMIEEGVLPGAFAPGYAVGIPGLATLESDPFRFRDTVQRTGDLVDLGERITADPLNLADTVYDGPVSRTLPFLTFSHDAAAGVMSLENKRIAIDWTAAGEDAALQHTEEVLKTACDAIQAEYMPFLTSSAAFGNRTMVVHPLGGCGLGCREHRLPGLRRSGWPA